MLTKDLENENEKRTTREWQYYAEQGVQHATDTYNRIRARVTEMEEQYAKDIAYLESCHLGLEDFTFNGIINSLLASKDDSRSVADKLMKDLKEHFSALVDAKAQLIEGDDITEEQKQILSETEVSKLNWKRNLPAALARIKLLVAAQNCEEQPQQGLAHNFKAMPVRIYVSLARAEYEMKKATLLRDLMLKE